MRWPPGRAVLPSGRREPIPPHVVLLAIATVATLIAAGGIGWAMDRGLGLLVAVATATGLLSLLAAAANLPSEQ